jgi:hypothetical protein
MNNYNDTTEQQESFQQAWGQLRTALREVERAMVACERTMGAIIPASKPGRSLNKLQMIEQILGEKPDLDIVQLNDELRRAGYSFYARNPIGATRATLYSEAGKALITSKAGKFSLKK